jgi:transposase-like protein
MSNDDFWRQQEDESRYEFEMRMQRLKESASESLTIDARQNPRLSAALETCLREIEEVLNKVNGVKK